ncbi:MAG: Flp family type IVb pilin [Anaerolineae bacterium]
MLYLYLRMLPWLRARGERGQTLVEYALIIVLIAVFLIVALTLLKNQLSESYSMIVSSLAVRPS